VDKFILRWQPLSLDFVDIYKYRKKKEMFLKRKKIKLSTAGGINDFKEKTEYLNR